jgi:hypothetical protein
VFLIHSIGLVSLAASGRFLRPVPKGEVVFRHYSRNLARQLPNSHTDHWTVMQIYAIQILFAMILAVKKLMSGFTKKPPTKAASA